jgi:hypothetical protein
MDERIKEILTEKLKECLNKNGQVPEPINSLVQKFSYEHPAHSIPIKNGIIVGRLYNSFFYQCRRILKRSPSDYEFAEFVEFVKDSNVLRNDY